MADPFTMMAVGAVVGAGAGYAGARKGNYGIRQAMGSTYQAAQRQMLQQSVASALDQAKNVKTAEKIIGAVRVAGSESGGVEGSYSALIRQADIDANLNKTIIDINLANQQTKTQSRTAAELVQLRNQMKNPLMAAGTGAIQGAFVGNAIGGLFGSLGATAAVAPGTVGVTGGTTMFNPLEYGGAVL